MTKCYSVFFSCHRQICVTFHQSFHLPNQTCQISPHGPQTGGYSADCSASLHPDFYHPFYCHSQAIKEILVLHLGTIIETHVGVIMQGGSQTTGGLVVKELVVKESGSSSSFSSSYLLALCMCIFVLYGIRIKFGCRL